MQNLTKKNYAKKLIKKDIDLKLENIIKIKELSKKVQDLKSPKISKPIKQEVNLDSLNTNPQRLIEPISFYPLTQTQGPEGRGVNNSLYLLNNLKEAGAENLILRKKAGVDIRNYLNSLIQFNKISSKEQSILYQFNKANNKPYKFLSDKASNLLKLSFLSMGCLISRPVYKLTYTKNNLEFEHNTPFQNILATNSKKIIIDLFYFIRTNKNKYLNKTVEGPEGTVVTVPSLAGVGPFKNNIGAPNPSSKVEVAKLGPGAENNVIYISHPKYASLTQKDNGQRGKILLKNILCKYNDKFQYLSDYLSSLFKSEVELNLVCLPKTYYDSNILVQDLALKSYKYRFVKLVSRLYRKANISASSKEILDDPSYLSQFISFPSYLSGINIKLAGRTFRQRVVPRMTVKRSQKGSLSNVNVQFIDRARFTGKTRRGSFSFTVTLGHVFK